MTHRTKFRLRCLLAFLVLLLLVRTAPAADEVRVMTSGAFTAAHQALAQEFERTTGRTVVTIYGASMGSGETTIPRRLERGEAADVVILAKSALDDLAARGLVLADTRVDLVRSSIAMAVRSGAA